MQFTNVNEAASLEWLDLEKLAFRFEYSNRFYGSCIFTANLVQSRNRLSLDENSLSSEEFAIERGSTRVLLSLSTIFLNQVLMSYKSLEDFLAMT
jgi:hypothetical protein